MYRITWTNDEGQLIEQLWTGHEPEGEDYIQLDELVDETVT